MNFSHLLHLQVKEHNEGIFLVWQCPGCAKPQPFTLVASKAGASLAGLEISEPYTMLDLRCAACGYELAVPPAERGLLAQAKEATTLLLKDELTAESYRAAILNLPARFVQDLVSLTETWQCAKCREDNPLNFTSCWNCQSPGGSAFARKTEDGPSAPILPRGGFPWV